MKRIAILQSNYIPWKGYFDIIRSVDEFIIYDDVQYTRRDWRNRNTIKTGDGIKWLTIPVKVKGKYDQLVCETEISGKEWTVKHWKTIKHNYGKSPFFNKYEEQFGDAYMKAAEYHFLTEVNILFIKMICSILGTRTRICRSTDYIPEGKSSDRILSICRQAEAKEYITGPSGLNYLNTEKFIKEGIRVAIADYSKYSVYDQIYPPFSHNVSVIDLIFSTGKMATNYMRRF